MNLPQGYSMVMAATDTGMFATVSACSKTEPVEITIRRIEAIDLGAAEAVAFRVAWPTEEDPAKIGAGRLPLPSMYRRAEGATGTLVRCRTNPARELDIAVLLPQATTEPVIVRGISVTYEADGTAFRAVADVDLGLCPVEPLPGISASEGCSGD